MKKLINILKGINKNELFGVFIVVYMIVILWYAYSVTQSYSDYIIKYEALTTEYESIKGINEELTMALNSKADICESLTIENNALSKQLEKKPVKDILQIAGDIYGIDPRLLEAIERLETGHYTSHKYKTQNNTWGAYDGVEYKSFESHEQSTMELARTLKWYYVDEGLDTIESIGTKYCPDDPEWALKVRAIYNELSKE